MKIKELKSIKETPAEYDEIERIIRRLWKQEIYLPLLRELKAPTSVLKNAAPSLISAIESGRIVFRQGVFTGEFTAAYSRELKSFGATWDRGAKGFRIHLSRLPQDVSSAVRASEARFRLTTERINKKLQQILPAEIAGKLKTEKIFDATLWKVEKGFEESIKGITVSPKLSDSERAKIAKNYTENLQLYVQKWSEEEILKLRKKIEKRALSGVRYESLIKTIKASYGQSTKKAKFLAKQETSLMMSNYKESRYTAVGVEEYKWGCVAGSPQHPVRPSHKKLEGKIFRWDDPPVTTEPGQPVRRNNPGRDFGCRCFAIPIVRF